MKQFLIVAFVALLVLCVVGTLQKLDEIEAQKALENLSATEEGNAQDVPENPHANVERKVTVDVDLTRMNRTMQMTAAYRLMANPREFVGKTFRMSGMFLTRVDEKDGKRYFGCQFYDPGCSCCAPGVLEFVPKDSYSWPEDFPPEQSSAKIIGRLELYDIDVGKHVYTVPHLVDAYVDKAR